jgi:hypothetical protein
MSRDRRNWTPPTATETDKEADSRPVAPEAAQDAAHADHGELLRRAEKVIAYVWGEAPPFKDLADLLSDIRAAISTGG